MTVPRTHQCRLVTARIVEKKTDASALVVGRFETGTGRREGVFGRR